jgi:SAM-dependent MidA family methyltransferase
VTPLERELRERIRAEGPISVEAYMEACNVYYYATRDPLGARGDFVTAPEVSQMFGEMVGAALADCWKRAGSPEDAIYIELGPGRGTLASDALRVMQGIGFSGGVHFVEASPVLHDAQRERHPDARWHQGLRTIPQGRSLLLVANEFFDALPVRQLIGGIERRVTVQSDKLAFDRYGDVVEDSPSREAVAREIGTLLAARGGVALLIDYGHERSAPGETLQAIRGHKYAPVLDEPGEQDLTAHVDFEALAAAATRAGASVTGVVPQGEWLNRLGIGARAAALSNASPERAVELAAAVQRLTGKAAMGELFKVIAIQSPGWPQPAGFAE